MGDRGNIFIKMHPYSAPNEGVLEGIYIYSHWAGYVLPERLQEALIKGKSRWDDEPYLARIIFQGVLKGDEDITGFGLSTYLTDNEYPVLVVDSKTETVSVSHHPSEAPFRTVSFADYIQLSEKELRRFRDKDTLDEDPD